MVSVKWICVALVMGLQTWGSAQDNWINWFDSSYFHLVYNSIGGQRDWHSARQYCNGYGGDLASLKHDSDLRNALKYMQNDNLYWIGVSKFMDDEWRFAYDDEVATEDETRWDRDAGYPKAVSTAKCVYIQQESNGLWRNGQCGKPGNYICQRGMDSFHTTKLLPTIAPTTGNCPYGYYELAGKCYAVFYHGERSWAEALGACEAQNAGRWQSLASFHSQAEYAIVMAQLNERNEKRLWIGYYSGEIPLNNSPQWYWSDNSPNDFNRLFGQQASTACAYISGKHPQHWIPANCDEEYGYVCQTYLDGTSPPTTPSPQCPPGYYYYRNACYILDDTEQTWDQADKACQNEANSTLVSIHSATENAAVLGYLATMGVEVDAVWIGLRISIKDGEYSWSDGSAVTYTNMLSQAPLDCASIDLEGRWRTSLCTWKQPALCKKALGSLPTNPPAIDGDCPFSDGQPWEKYGSHCYQYHSDVQPWGQAAILCSVSHHDAALASVHHAGENEFILKLHKKHQPDGAYQNLWLGLRSNEENELEWIDGGPVQYETWEPNEPSTKEGNCTAMRVNKAFGEPSTHWRMQSCGAFNDFVCKTEVVPPRPPTTPFPGYCPDDGDGEWVAYGPRCYLFRPDATATWQKGQARCRARGANLITIQDKQENDFVYELAFEKQHLPLKRYYWIGLRRYHADEPYRWVESGENATEFFWDASANLDYNYDAVMVSTDTGTWFPALSSTAHHGYVCKVDKASTPGAFTSTTTAASTKRSEETEQKPSTGMSSGEIAGLVIGLLVLVALIVVGVIFGGPKLKKLYEEWRGEKPTELVNEEE